MRAQGHGERRTRKRQGVHSIQGPWQGPCFSSPPRGPPWAWAMEAGEVSDPAPVPWALAWLSFSKKIVLLAVLLSLLPGLTAHSGFISLNGWDLLYTREGFLETWFETRFGQIKPTSHCSGLSQV